MDQNANLSVQSVLPEIHQQYLDYRLAINNKAEGKIINDLKNSFLQSLASYQQFFETNNKGYTLFAYFIVYHDIEVITLVLNKIKKLDLPKNTAQSILEDTVATENTDLLRLLVQHGLDVDLFDGARCTQLQLAASRCDINLCAMLLACGANLKFINVISQKSILASAFENNEQDSNKKIALINFLLICYLANKFEPNLSKIDIPNDIANKIFLFGAKRFGEIIIPDTHPQFQYAFESFKSFLDEVEKMIKGIAKPIDFTSLKMALKEGLNIYPNNDILKKLSHTLDSFDTASLSQKVQAVDYNNTLPLNSHDKPPSIKP